MWAAYVRDLPDPVGYEDFAHQPALTAATILDRHQRGRFPVDVDLYPLPKRTGYRRLSWLDPLDDISLRVLVGRMTATIAKACDQSSVLSYPLETTGPGWSTRPHKKVIAERRARGLGLLDDPACAALGTFDVAEYYPSVDLTILSEQLCRLGAPAGAVFRLVEALGALRELGGSPGLPMGFEGSGPLANVYLLGADAVATDCRVGLLRYTDDAWLFLRDEADWDRAVLEWCGLLSDLRLKPQWNKVNLYPKESGDPWSVIRSGILDSLTEGSTRWASADEALELLVGDLETGTSDETVRRFCLAVLSSKRDVRGVNVLMEHPSLADELPKPVGDYLVALARDTSARAAVDHEWLIEQIERPSDPSSLAGRLQLCRAASHLHFSQNNGSALARLASSEDERAHVPLRTWAAVAWSHSEDWKRGRAEEAARYEGSRSVRRGYVLGLRRAADTRRGRRALEQLGRTDPDLMPTIAYALAG